MSGVTDATRRPGDRSGERHRSGGVSCLAAPDVALLVHTRKNRDGAERVAAAARAAGADAEIALGDLADPAVADALVARRSRGSAD